MAIVRETDPAVIQVALKAVLASNVIAEVHARRCEQVTVHGHTPAVDAQKQLGSMIRKVAEMAGTATDHCGHGQHASADNLKAGRKHMLTAAALAIAIIDRIDADLAQLQAELDQEGGQPGLSGPSQPGQSKEIS